MKYKIYLKEPTGISYIILNNEEDAINRASRKDFIYCTYYYGDNNKS